MTDRRESDQSTLNTSLIKIIGPDSDSRSRSWPEGLVFRHIRLIQGEATNYRMHPSR